MFLQLTRPSGDAVIVNSEQIRFIGKGEHGASATVYADAAPIHVMETVGEIARALGAARPSEVE